MMTASDQLQETATGRSPSLRSSQKSRIGKVAELRAMAELLLRGHDVAVPVVDDAGVDLVLNAGVTAQVKCASRAANWNKGYASCSYSFSFRTYRYRAGGERSEGAATNRFAADVFLLHAADINGWWIVPRSVLDRVGVTAEQPKNISVSTSPRSFQGERSALLSGFRDAWHVLDRWEEWQCV